MIPSSFFGKESSLHHIGLAVKSIRETSPSSVPVAEESQGVWIAFIDIDGVRIELLEPRGEDSPIANSLRKGIKLLHLCYEVPSLEAALEACRPAGFHRLGPPVRVKVFDDRRIVWVFSRQFGLFELLERESKREGSPGG
jgi:methylmalonyl-CoA/ethylmalonyl-CoA epimerase